MPIIAETFKELYIVLGCESINLFSIIFHSFFLRTIALRVALTLMSGFFKAVAFPFLGLCRNVKTIGLI